MFHPKTSSFFSVQNGDIVQLLPFISPLAYSFLSGWHSQTSRVNFLREDNSWATWFLIGPGPSKGGSRGFRQSLVAKLCLDWCGGIWNVFIRVKMFNELKGYLFQIFKIYRFNQKSMFFDQELSAKS